MVPVPDSRPHVAVLNWRDTRHPEGGGSELYVERIAAGLVGMGYRVTIHCAEHAEAPRDEIVDEVRFRRRGSRFTVYLWALLGVLRQRPDLVVDVQNGIPFLARLVTRRPVLVLVHHVHREQWRSAVGEVLGRLGWWIESWLAPRVYRNCRYVAVSDVSRDELVALGVDALRITVVRPGLDAPPRTNTEQDESPTLVVVGRLVPHKRVEHAIDVLARLAEQWPKLRLEVVGHGWWQDNLASHARDLAVEDRVTLHGFVDEQDKHEILARASLHLCASVKEGWGIAIMEAAAHGVPSIAYRAAGGVAESIVDNQTGLLAQDFDDLVCLVDRLLRSPSERVRLGEAGRARTERFAWEVSVAKFEQAIRACRS